MSQEQARISRKISPGQKRFICATSFFAMLGGTLTLFGWIANIPRLTDWFNDGLSMFANPAICVILLSTGILFGICFNISQSVFLVRGLSSLSLFVAIVTLIEHFFNVNLGIDTLIVERSWGQNASVSPMRMGIPASTSILILATSLFLTTLSEPWRKLASVLATCSLFICCISIVGYWFGSNPLYGIAGTTAIARQTSLMLVAVGTALIASVPEQGFYAMLIHRDAGGTMVRRLILPVVFLPLLVGWLRIEGERHGYFDFEFGNALQAMIEIVAFTLLLTLTARSVSKHASVLEKTQKQLVSIVESSDDAILSIDPNEIIQSWNKGAERLFGYSRREAIGQSIQILIPPQSRAAEGRILQRVSSGEQVLAREAKRIRKSGEEIDVSITTSRIFNEEGQTIGYSKIVRDISERKRAEEMVKQASRNKDEFLASLSHELRNPLSPISISLSLLSEDASLSGNGKELVAIAERQLKQLVRLVDDLLDVSRISRGKVILQKSRCNLQDVVKLAVESVQSLCDECSHTLKVSLCDEKVYVDGDAARLTQIVTNILNNAARYTPDGGNIQVTLRQTDTDGIIEVADNGIGIPQDHLQSVFGLFTQLTQGDVSGKAGLGIGLALVKQLVDLHTGTVEIFSEGEGHGTRVVVQLPRIAASEIGDSNSTRSESVAAQLIPTKARRVMIVDDMRANTFTLNQLLTRMGHTVQMANSGEVALQEIGLFKPEVLISDISMPGIDGYELASRIRQRFGNSIQLVALTGYGSPADREETQRHGFDAHFVKPPDARALAEYFRKLDEQHGSSSESKS